MISRRQFLQMATVTASFLGPWSNWPKASAQQKISQDDLLKFNSKDKLLCFTLQISTPSLSQYISAHHQKTLELVSLRDSRHTCCGRFFESFNAPGTPLAYAHTMVDYVNLAKAYGRLGGLDRTATLIKAIRADRGEKNVLLLDGGDTWQGSFSSLKTNGQDMVDAMAKLQPDAMVGHWEFTFGVDRVQEIIESITVHFLAVTFLILNG